MTSNENEIPFGLKVKGFARGEGLFISFYCTQLKLEHSGKKSIKLLGEVEVCCTDILTVVQKT